MRRICYFMLSLVLLLGLAACGPAGDSGDKDDPAPSVVTNQTYQSYWMKQHDYKTMPIAAFNTVPPKVGAYAQNFITEENYRILAESGINTAYCLYDKLDTYPEDVINALAYCEKYGVSYVAGLNNAYGQTSSSILESVIYQTLIKNKPKALGGVMIMDEPSYINMNAMATSRKCFEELLDKKLYYSGNLFPTYATQEQLYNRCTGSPALPEGGYSYEQYVQDYIELYKPQALSYDYYPVQGSYPNLSGGYYENMSIIRKYAMQAEIPFWVYIQTCSFNANVRIPTEEEINWLVNSSLAYGCKGIQYFTYWCPLSGGEVFNGAMIDVDGNKTEVYGYVQKINRQIAAVDEVLMCSLSKGIMVSGTSPCAIPEEDVIESYQNLTDVSGATALVGCFDYNGKPAYYVFNNNNTSQEAISLTFDSPCKGYTVQAAEKETFSDTSVMELTLKAGEAVLVVLE